MSIVKGVALVTGSAQGIGRSIALRLAQDGFHIALNDLPSKRDQLHAVAEDIDKLGQRTLLVPADVTIDRDVKEMVQKTSSEFGGIDVMVANAGVSHLASLMSTEVAQWERVMANNARGPFLCYKYAAQQMIEQGRGGRIVGASSIGGRNAFPLAAAYCASKFAVRGLTQAAAQELGRYNITVNAYAPGPIPTALYNTAVDTLSEVDPEMYLPLVNRMNTRSIKYDGQSEDIANVVSFLVSKEAHFITGQCITVDGGNTLS